MLILEMFYEKKSFSPLKYVSPNTFFQWQICFLTKAITRGLRYAKWHSLYSIRYRDGGMEYKCIDELLALTHLTIWL